jgi:hypothetical protein
MEEFAVAIHISATCLRGTFTDVSLENTGGGERNLIVYLHAAHWTPTTNVTWPSTESSVSSPVAVLTVLLKRTWESIFRGSAAPQGDQTVDVNGMESVIS